VSDTQASPATGSDPEDLARIAKGGRTNAMGFLIRLAGGIPFLFIGYRIYGVDDMGRFAAAFVIIEMLALICALGEKRGLAQRLTEGAEEDGQKRVNLVFDGMLTSLFFSLIACAILLIFPVIIFPSGMNSDVDIWIDRNPAGGPSLQIRYCDDSSRPRHRGAMDKVDCGGRVLLSSNGCGRQ